MNFSTLCGVLATPYGMVCDRFSNVTSGRRNHHVQGPYFDGQTLRDIDVKFYIAPVPGERASMLSFQFDVVYTTGDQTEIQRLAFRLLHTQAKAD